MLIILGTVSVPPERVEAARAPMRAMVEASRLEDGCHGYAYAEDLLEAGLVHVSELWRDQAALDAHFQTPHMAEWRQAWRPIGIRDRRLFKYEAGEGAPF